MQDTNMSNPLVSFCIPAYGRGKFIAATLRSALAQTVENIEIIVVDDRSPDNTAEVVKGFSDKRIHYFLNPENLGMPENLNRAMSLGSGEYLVLLEDHDLLEPTYLEAALSVMDRYPTVGFVATGLVTIDEQDKPLERYEGTLPEFMPGRKLLRRLLTRTDCPFSVTTVMRRSAIEGVKPLFDSRYWWYADQYLWLRLCAKSDFGFVDQPLLKFRTREAGHHLENRHWESSLCLNKIRRDNWHLLHPHFSFMSLWDSLLYEKSKFVQIAKWRGGRMLRADSWSKEDVVSSKSYLSFLSRCMLSVVGILPLWLVAKLREILKPHHS